MAPRAAYDICENESWRTITAGQTNHGYAVFEAAHRFWRERMAESVLRVVGVSLILIGYVQWFLPDWALQGNPMLARMALSAVFMGTGIALYLFASRGFRKEVHFDLVERQISIGRLNGKDHCMISRQIPFARIESLFVQRAQGAHGMAALFVRLKGFSPTHCVMRGAQSEIEDLHRHLSRDIQLAQSAPQPDVAVLGARHSPFAAPTPVRPVLAARPKSGTRKVEPTRVRHLAAG